jgi:MFS family permease
LSDEPGGPIVDEHQKVPAYSWYALSVLVLVYVLNFIDRQILSILANDIKADLKVDDAYLGFLYGTAFAIFYALFGIPLGKLADSWKRVRLMSVGLALWSLMTAFSGFAKNGAMLTFARIGVGVGEATASPSAYSLISDWFPARLRATALAIYSSGLYFGGGISLLIGGVIKDNWIDAFPGGGPLGLVGWQAAFISVGVPGLLLALWVLTLREPVRGAIDGLPTREDPAPFRKFFDELVLIIPPFTLIGAMRRGATALAVNLAAAAFFALSAVMLTRWVYAGPGIVIRAVSDQWLLHAVG